MSLLVGGMSVFDGATGALVWQTPTSKVWPGATTSALGKVFVGGANDATLRVFNEQGCGHPTCAPLWTAPTPGPVSVAPVVAGGHVFVATTNGRVAEYAANGCGKSVCAPVAVGDTGSHHAVNNQSRPVVAGGLLLATFDNRLVAFKIV